MHEHTDPYQHWIINLYTISGQPGGGGRRCPEDKYVITCMCKKKGKKQQYLIEYVQYRASSTGYREQT